MTPPETPPETRGAARHVVARASDVPEGERLIVEVAGRQVGIFHLDGEFHALLHRCPHLGGPLCLGPVVGLISADVPGETHYDPGQRFVMCPWHGWEFDVRTGRSYVDPHRTKARHFEVDVEPGVALADGRVPGPYTAETVPISVEEDYLVLWVRNRDRDRERGTS